jgi:L-lactate dehydrogenase complex protein LldE
MPDEQQRLQVALFVTCLADLFRPSVAFNSIALLEEAGCAVTVPQAQTCCGQPGYNSGDYSGTIPLAKQVITEFEFADYVVAPSGSCAGMICEHYPRLLSGQWRERALALAAKTFELTTFLTDIAPLPAAAQPLAMGEITYHDSCAGLRELNIKQQPRELLARRCNAELKELPNTEVCCGFGGAFCAKMPDISTKMADDKLAAAQSTGARTLVGGDLGCLLNLAGRASRSGVEIEVRHVAELLAGAVTKPAIGEGD